MIFVNLILVVGGVVRSSDTYPIVYVYGATSSGSAVRVAVCALAGQPCVGREPGGGGAGSRSIDESVNG